MIFRRALGASCACVASHKSDMISEDVIVKSFASFAWICNIYIEEGHPIKYSYHTHYTHQKLNRKMINIHSKRQMQPRNKL